jgi:hypothetical protein
VYDCNEERWIQSKVHAGRLVARMFNNREGFLLIQLLYADFKFLFFLFGMEIFY